MARIAGRVDSLLPFTEGRQTETAPRRGHIRKCGNRWQLSFWARGNDGTKKQRFVSFGSKEEAERAAELLGSLPDKNHAHLRLMHALAKSEQLVEWIDHGWPDLLVEFKDGSVWAIEVKSQNDRLHSEQIRLHALLQKMGVTVLLASEVAQANLLEGALLQPIHFRKMIRKKKHDPDSSGAVVR